MIAIKELKLMLVVLLYSLLLSVGFMAQADAITTDFSSTEVAKAKARVEQVNVQINQQLFQYAFDNKALAPRLADVLTPVALQNNWYWPASALYKTDDNAAQLLQQQVLQQLSALQLEYAADAKLQHALSRMAAQVKSWQLATRIFIPIDYDFARAVAKLNPRFTAGDYLLQLYPRPAQITVLGLVQQPGKISHKNAASVAAYTDEFKLLPAAATDILYVIQPDGRIDKVTVAAWQQPTIEAMPGAQLFVPFKPALFSAKWQNLNQSILALARHRVLL